jgi:Flp pilus assembly protein TadD
LAESLRQALSALVLALLGLSTSARLGRFGDRLSFARAAVATSPHSSLARRNLGVAYQRAGDLERAGSEYRAALELDGSEPLVHNNLAVILMAEGRLAEAEQELARELELHPGSAEAAQNLALVRQARKGQPPLSP